MDKWQCVGDNGINVLDAFYREPQRYAYTFQNYVFVTRVMQVLPPDDPLSSVLGRYGLDPPDYRSPRLCGL